MSRQFRLEEEKTTSQKVVVVKILQSKGFGDLLKIRDHLKHQKHIRCENISLDKENMEVLITGSNRKDIEKAISWHAKGMRNAGHGGYRINFKVTEREITLEEIITKKVEAVCEEKIKEINNECKKREEKWAKNKKGMITNIIKFGGKIRKQDLKITEFKNDKYELEKNLNLIGKELKTYQIPAYKIVWRRFKELVA
jgi:hypothetical protein